jgi:hypothetical protein
VSAFRYCRCADNPYSFVDWDVWVSDPDRAWCRSCGLDLRPEEAKREYAIGTSELERLQAKFPEMFS